MRYGGLTSLKQATDALQAIVHNRFLSAMLRVINPEALAHCQRALETALTDEYHPEFVWQRQSAGITALKALRASGGAA